MSIKSSFNTEIKRLKIGGLSIDDMKSYKHHPTWFLAYRNLDFIFGNWFKHFDTCIVLHDFDVG